MPLALTPQPEQLLSPEAARRNAEIQMDLERLRHKHQQERLATFAGYALKGLALVGGVALFPLGYPLAGGFLIGASLDLLSRTALKRAAKAALKNYLGDDSNKE